MYVLILWDVIIFCDSVVFFIVYFLGLTEYQIYSNVGAPPGGTKLAVYFFLLRIKNWERNFCPDFKSVQKYLEGNAGKID